MRFLSRSGLPILIIVYLGLAIVTSQTLHFSRALDEGYHLDYITFIKQQGRLPTSYEERAQITRSDYPPLYHLLVASLAGGVQVDKHPDFKYFWDSFRYRAIDHLQRENPWTFDTEDFRWPYYGKFLVWQIGRWFSIFLGAATLIVVFLTLKDVPIGPKPLTPLFGTALLGVLPRYVFGSAALNDDNLLGLVAALYFWMLVKVVKSPARLGAFILLGLLLGISVTVKYSMVLIPVEVLSVCGFIAYRQKLGWAWWLKRVTVVGTLAVAATLWWFGWIFWFFNTINQDGWLTGLSRALFVGGYDDTLNKLGTILGGTNENVANGAEIAANGRLIDWVMGVFFSFWGYSINNGYPGYPYSYFLIAVVLISVALGLWRLWRIDDEAHVWITLALFHLGLLTILPFLRFYLTGRIGYSAQGRYILVPALTAVVALIVWGLLTLVPKRWTKLTVACLIASTFSWTLFHLYQLSAHASEPLPLRTIAQAAEWLSEPAHIQFGDELELVSFDLDAKPHKGCLNLDLAWRLLDASIRQSYLLQVRLIDEAGNAVSHWAGYHGGGRLPTLAWDPGDTVFDRLSLPLPQLPAGYYSIQLQLLDRHGQPVAAKFGNSADGASPQIELTKIVIEAPSEFEFPDGSLSVWHSAGPSGDLKFRYPGTISIITPDADAELRMLDPLTGRWEPTLTTSRVSTFVIGPRWPSGLYQIVLDGQPVGASVEVINWWQRQFEIPPIDTSLEVNFADQIYLLGYHLPNSQVKAGDSLPITLYWQAPLDRSPQADFIQFNNLLSSSGSLSGGYDRKPKEFYSTLLWAPGEVVVDGYTVPVDVEAKPGEYYLDVGFYLVVGESTVSLPLVVDGTVTKVSSVSIGPIHVTE